ncbi:MAG: hypothetical protein EBU47_08510, partial [Betaproteobacteria bacterium]|nr:hypothetical protein [Betaproteobacteria bacterium]
LHLAMYASRPKAQAIIHLHGSQSVALSLLAITGVDPQAQPLLVGLLQLGFSQRALHAVIRVAQSIADMLGLERVDDRCLALASQLRRLPSFEQAC